MVMRTSAVPSSRSRAIAESGGGIERDRHQQSKARELVGVRGEREGAVVGTDPAQRARGGHQRAGEPEPRGVHHDDAVVDPDPGPERIERRPRASSRGRARARDRPRAPRANRRSHSDQRCAGQPGDGAVPARRIQVEIGELEPQGIRAPPRRQHRSQSPRPSPCRAGPAHRRARTCRSSGPSRCTGPLRPPSDGERGEGTPNAFEVEGHEIEIGVERDDAVPRVDPDPSFACSSRAGPGRAAPGGR